MTGAEEFLGDMSAMLGLVTFLTSPRAPEWVRTVEALSLGRCPGCGYRWSTGRHQAPWVGHA